MGSSPWFLPWVEVATDQQRPASHSSRRDVHWLLRGRDLPAQRLKCLDVDLGESRKRLDRVTQNLNRYAGANRQRRLLKPLASLGSERVRTGQTLAVGKQGQEPVALGVRARVRLGLRELRQACCPAEGAVGRARGGRLRVGEDDPRDSVVVSLSRLAEDIRSNDLALVLTDVGQRPDAGDVADRP